MNLELLLLTPYEFFKTGLSALGGGLVTIPFLTEMVNKYHWLTVDMLTDIIAVSESTPGATGINMTTYTGYHINGVLGGITATPGLAVPSTIMIRIVAQFLKKLKDSELVKSIFCSIRPAVTVLITSAGITIFITALFQNSENFMEMVRWSCILLLAVIFYLSNKRKQHPVLRIAASAAVGMLFQLQNIWGASLPIFAVNYLILETIEKYKIANILIYIKESGPIDFNDILSTFIRKRRGLSHCAKYLFFTLLYPCLIYSRSLLADRFPIIRTEGYPTITVIDIVG